MSVLRLLCQKLRDLWWRPDLPELVKFVLRLESTSPFQATRVFWLTIPDSVWFVIVGTEKDILSMCPEQEPKL